MGNVTHGKIPRQAKPEFILRETPAWLLSHQDWISDGARKLYLAMRGLADAKTGELAVPGRGDEARWIKPKTIDRKAGMCDETRKKYMRELLALDAVRHERKRITRRVGSRLRAFLGVSRYTLLELKRPIAASNAVSSTAKIEEKTQIVSVDAVSSTAKAKTGLLRPTSSMVEEIGHEDLSETTLGTGSVLHAVPSDLEDSHIERARGFQKAPPAKSAHGPLYMKKLENLTRFLEDEFFWRARPSYAPYRGEPLDFASISFADIEYLAIKVFVDPQGIAMGDFRRCYNAAMRKVECGVAEILRSREPVDDPRPIDRVALKEFAEQTEALEYYIETEFGRNGRPYAVVVHQDHSHTIFVEGEYFPCWHPPGEFWNPPDSENEKTPIAPPPETAAP